MPPLPCTVSYPQTTYDFVDAAGLVHTTLVAEGIVTPQITPAMIIDGSATHGNASQVLTAGMGGSIYWQDAAVPSLAAVLGESPDAGGLTITNLASMALSADGVTSCVLSAGASSDLLNISTVADDSGSTYAFSGKYWPLVIDGTLYRVPLFV